MFPRLLDESEDVGIFEAVEDHFPLLPALDEAKCSEESQVMRDRRQAHLQEEGQVADAELTLSEQVQDLRSCLVRERLEELRDSRDFE